MPELSQDDIRYLVALSRMLRGIRGTGVTVTSAGITINSPQRQDPPSLPDGWAFIRITNDSGTGNGNYNARIQRAKTGGTFVSSSNLTPSSWLEDVSSSDDCVLAVSTDSSHSFKTDGTQYLLAKFVRMSDDSKPLPVYAPSGGAGDLPTGGSHYQVLMVIDNLGTWGIDWPRFH